MPNPFDTETMAELHAAQGRIAEAITIYRRLAAAARDHEVRARCERRAAELDDRQAAPADPAEDLPEPVAPAAPGIAVAHRGEHVAIAWALPDEARPPALQLLLVTLTTAGVETSTRTLALPMQAGRMSLGVPGLRRAAAAVGTLDGDVFVPLAHAAGTPPAGS